MTSTKCQKGDYMFINKTQNGIEKIAVLSDENSGRTMEVYTDAIGVQFYAGNFLDGSFIGKKGVAHPQRSAFCFETQHYPDTPNQPSFPSTLVRPEDTYKTTTVYKFGVK